MSACKSKPPRPFLQLEHHRSSLQKSQFILIIIFSLKGKETVGGFCYFLPPLIHGSFCHMPKGKGERGRARVRLWFGPDSKQMCRPLLGKVGRALVEKLVPSGCTSG